MSLARFLIVVPAALAGAQPAPAAQEPSFTFVERALELGLDHETLTSFDDIGIPPKVVRDWAQSGIAWGDLDGDTDPDLVACGSLLPNQVFLNPRFGPAGPDGTWTEVGEQLGIRSGWVDRVPALGDFDKDGDLDLFIGAYEGTGVGAIEGRGRLYENLSGLEFQDVTARSGARGHGRTIFALWHDLDLDGWLDLYTGEFNATPNAWYRNQGNGSFTERGVPNGLADAGQAHVVGAADLDLDGSPEVVVGNDHLVGEVVEMSPELNKGDAYLVGDADGQFVDLTPGSGLGQERGIMGIAFADVNADGLLDVYKTDIGSNFLLVADPEQSSGTPFVDEASFYGVVCNAVPFPEDPDTWGVTSGWAAIFFDVDLDGWDDLFVANGHVSDAFEGPSKLPRLQQNFMFRSRGPEYQFRFQDVTKTLGLIDNFDDRAAAVADVDGDGDFDLTVVETAGRLRQFENEHGHLINGYVSVRVEGSSSAPGGEGAVLSWTDGQGFVHQRPIGGDGPTASQNELRAIFGIGTLEAVDLSVAFPSGMTIQQDGVPRDSELVVSEPELFTIDVHTLPAASSPGGSLFDEFDVVVVARDAQGVALGSGADVSIEVPGLEPDSPLVDLGDGRYMRSFKTTSAPGGYRVVTDLAGFAPRVRPVLTLTGPPDGQRSEVTVSAEALRADSGDRSELRVTPRDANGIVLGAGLSVTANVIGADPITFSDGGDGTYTGLLLAPPTQGTVSVRVFVDGVQLDAPVQIDVAGPANSTQTEVVVYPPKRQHAASPNCVPLRVVPRDAAGRRRGPFSEVVLVPRPPADGGATVAPQVPRQSAVTAAAASAHAQRQAPGGPVIPGPPASQQGVAVIESLDALPRADGSFLFVLDVEDWVFTHNTTTEVELWIDGQLLSVVDVQLESGPGVPF